MPGVRAGTFFLVVWLPISCPAGAHSPELTQVPCTWLGTVCSLLTPSWAPTSPASP